ncbi:MULTISPECIES: phage head closure protein [Priestia]|nr:MULTISPECIES: phage head closure protein [Priestia]SCC50690.1 phage head-tail adaptor, putative, SPP1 family [Priestia flexa]
MKYIKDKKLTILEMAANSGPEPGETARPLKNGENIWAYYRQASANEIAMFSTTVYKVEVIFKIAWRNDIDTTMKVLFRGKEYAINRIDDFEGYKQDLTIYAYALN